MSQPAAKPVVWYFADPMCSWCWGFAPVIRHLREEFGDRVSFVLNPGGLRPGATTPMGAAAREEILHHWHQVHAMTGQAFRFEGALPDGFVYDTEPASRAVVALAALKPNATLDYLAALQHAFYVEGRDITRETELSELARGMDVDVESFLDKFRDVATRERTRRQFQRSRLAGVRGFPTLIWQHGDEVAVVCQGWVPYERIAAEIARRLRSALP